MDSQNSKHRTAQLDEDTELMFRVVKGDPVAFDRLYQKYLVIVAAFLTRLNGCWTPVDDLTQDVFTRLWQNRRQFRGDSSVRNYILGIARNVSSDHKKLLAREIAHRHRVLQEHVLADMSNSPSPDIQSCLAEIKTALKSAISQLTAKQREAVTLFYFERLPSQEAMAQRAGCSPEAFRSRLRQAHTRLSRLMGNAKSRKLRFCDS
jgi:RNA polymerase sigma-70 factor (ECF subfamily)